MRFSRAIVGAGVGLALGIGWLYGSTLHLPPSLIDDVSCLTNRDALVGHIQRGEWSRAWFEDQAIRIRLLNPGHSVITALAYTISGGEPYHGAKMLSLWIVAMAVAMIPWAARKGRSEKVPGFLLGGVLAAFAFVGTEVPGTAGLQSVMANWWRLHTSDSYGALPVAGLLVGLAALGGQRAPLWSRRQLFLGLVWVAACYGAAVATKPTTAVLAAPIAFTGVVLAWGWGRRQAGWLLVGVGVGSALAAALWLAALAASAPPQGHQLPGASAGHGGAYGAGLTGPILLTRIARLGASLVHSTGLYGMVVLALAALLVWRTWQRWSRHRKKLRLTRVGWWIGWVLRRTGVEVTLLLSATLLLAVYLPWPHMLPRYLLLGLLALAGWASLVLADVWNGYGRGAKGWRRAGLSVVLLGTTISVLIWARAASLAMAQTYGEHEHRQSTVVDRLALLAKEGKTVGIVADPGDEQMGSLAYWVGRSANQPGFRFRAVESLEDLSGLDTVVTVQALTPGELWDAMEDTPGWKVTADFPPPKARIQTLPSLWTMARKLLQGQAPWTELEPQNAYRIHQRIR